MSDRIMRMDQIIGTAVVKGNKLCVLCCSERRKRLVACTIEIYLKGSPMPPSFSRMYVVCPKGKMMEGAPAVERMAGDEVLFRSAERWSVPFVKAGPEDKPSAMVYEINRELIEGIKARWGGRTEIDIE